MEDQDPYGSAAGAGIGEEGGDYYEQEMDEDVITQEDW
jgi:hypothetical protein